MSFLEDMKKLAAETRARQEDADVRRRAIRLADISAQCERFADSVRSDIEPDARGEGAFKGHVLGFIPYWLADEKGAHLQLRHGNRITLADIAATPGFQRLQSECQMLGVNVRLREEADEDASIEQETTIVSVIVDVSGWGSGPGN
jgi:hypothetical protein